VDFMNSSNGQMSEHIEIKIKPKVRITLKISWMPNAQSLFWVHAPLGQEQYFTNVLILIVCEVNELGPGLNPDQAPQFERNIQN